MLQHFPLLYVYNLLSYIQVSSINIYMVVGYFEFKRLDKLHGQ